MFNQPIEQVEPGAVLARTISEEPGQALLVAGTALTEGYLRSLRHRGYRSLPIRDGLADDVVPHDLVSQRVRSTISDHVATTFSQVSVLASDRGLGAGGVAGATEQLGDQPLDLGPDGDDLVAQLYADVEVLITELLETDTLAGLDTLRDHNDYTFQHSVDVAVIGVLLGKRLRLPRERLRELALGCLLHDLGKIYIDQAILDKPGALTRAEFQAIQEHPRMGFELVRRMPVASLLPAHVAYQHHERQAGGGYPQGMIGGGGVHSRAARERVGGGRMLLIAEIAAVADVYSALSADRPYRAAMAPDQVITTVRGMTGDHLHPEVVAALTSLVPSYPVGHWVQISGGLYEGWRGVVSRLHPRTLDRPVVRLLIDGWGKVLAEPGELDLADLPDDQGLRCLPAGEIPVQAPEAVGAAAAG